MKKPAQCTMACYTAADLKGITMLRYGNNLDEMVGQAAEISSSAYFYRCDRPADQNPPESWIGLIQYAKLPFDKPVNINAPAVKKVLCGLLWEEVRPIRRVELSWPPNAKQPSPNEVKLIYLDATDSSAHTWWNPATTREADKPKVTADGCTYVYAITADTWNVVASLRSEKNASIFAVPEIRAFIPDVWKKMELEIEWGFEDATVELEYDGRIEVYDGIISDVHPLPESGVDMKSSHAWRSAKIDNARRGVRLNVLYMGTSRWRRVWPYLTQPEDVARTILTVWTKSGSFSFKVSDLEQGPILASEYGFFVRSIATKQASGQKPTSYSELQILGRKMDEINWAGYMWIAPAQKLKNPDGEKYEVPDDVPKVPGWVIDNGSGRPWFGTNPTDESMSCVSTKIPARSVAVSPATEHDVAAGWRSPIKGQVAVKSKVAMSDIEMGEGIEWAMILKTKTAQQILAQGTVYKDAEKKLTAMAVEAGDILLLVVGARSRDHSCDNTIIIELVITELDGQGRIWNLTKDVIDDIHAGNPHADSCGNADVWQFYAFNPTVFAPAVSEPPFSLDSTAKTGKEFLKELAARNQKTIRQRVRKHPEQTWEDAVAAIHPNQPLPPHPNSAVEPTMQVEVPCKRLTAQWKLGPWHILRKSVKDSNGKWFFNDHPFGILAAETYMILRALDLQGMHKEAADGLDQWLKLPMEHQITPAHGAAMSAGGLCTGQHEWSRPDRPLGHFSDGKGCLTFAEGPNGMGGHMDGVHCMGPGVIMFILSEHFRLTGDMDWLRDNAPRMKANAEWILRQRQLLAGNIPGGRRLWSIGLQPAHVVTPDSECMYMQFYETEAYYWLAVKRMAEMLALIDQKEGERMAAESEAYRKDLLAAIDRSIVLTPVVPVRDGTYHSFVPFSPYVRGFATEAWGWRRCQGHVGAIYWDTTQSANHLISPAGLLSPRDRRIQGHLDVLEDRLLLENEKVNAKTSGYAPDKHWFSHASWQYQCGLERHTNIHLAADDAPNFIRSMLNQYAVDIIPREYIFREHTSGGPPDKIYEEACFLERFRNMLIMEQNQNLWLARAVPKAWLEHGKKISVKNAPTRFGTVNYEIVSKVNEAKITVTIELPSRDPPKAVLLRLRHPNTVTIRNVEVNGTLWNNFDKEKQLIRLEGLKGKIAVRVNY